VALLRDDRPDPEGLMRRLRGLRELEEVPACSETVRLLSNLELGEEQAEKLLLDILRHRTRVARALGRDPGLRVAAVDFLSNVESLLTNPKIVEMSQFEETQRSAITDPLTGLYNRRYLRTALRREVRRSHRHGGVFSVLLLDLDRFKAVNDRYGHMLGDLVLRRVSRVIRRGVRDADIACRYGGEEFAVLFPETDRLGAYIAAERMRRGVAASFSERPTGGRKIPMTVSGGIASFPDDGGESSTLIARADETLYRAKRAGRNRVMLHPMERRRSVRYPARPSAAVRVQREGESAHCDAAGINFSLDGALVETDRTWQVSESIRLVLGRDADRLRGEPRVVRGKVVRVEADDAKKGRARIGVAFETPIPEPLLMQQVIRGSGGARLSAEGAP
jgi:diguanylate cyclase (GGDEF)-like protein